MKEWRRTMAREQGVAAFVVMHDTTLDEICRVQPRSRAELRTISGIGERKAELYGAEVLAVLERYREGARASAAPMEKKTLPALETMRLLNEGKSFEEIAEIRGRQLSTVINAVASLVEKGEIEFKSEWIDSAKQSVIEAGCATVGGPDRIERLRTLKDVLPPEITYDEIRLVVAHLRRERRGAIPA
jgi:ATP-dependent DNA helicase RecQ